MKSLFKIMFYILLFLLLAFGICCGIWAICDKDGLIETYNSIFHPQNSGAIIGNYKIIDETEEEKIILYLKIDEEKITYIIDNNKNNLSVDDCLSQENTITIDKYILTPQYKQRNYKILSKNGFEDLSKIIIVRISNQEFLKQIPVEG